MKKHKVYFNNGTEIVELNQDSDVKGVSPPFLYSEPVWFDSLKWIELINQLPKYKKLLFQNRIDINYNDKR